MTLGNTTGAAVAGEPDLRESTKLAKGVEVAGVHQYADAMHLISWILFTFTPVLGMKTFYCDDG